MFLPSDKTPASAQANLDFPTWGQGEGLGDCAVLLVRLCCPALFICAIIFVTIVLSVVATPLPPALGPICLPGLPAPHLAALGSLRLMLAPAARPSQQRHMTQQPAQSTSFWGGQGWSAAQQEV